MKYFNISIINEGKEHYKRKMKFANMLLKEGFDIIIEPTPDNRSLFLEKHGIKDCFCERIPDIIAIRPDYVRSIWIEIQLNGKKRYSKIDWKRIKRNFLYIEVTSDNLGLFLHILNAKINKNKRRREKWIKTHILRQKRKKENN